MLKQLGIQGFKAVFNSSIRIGDFTLLIGRNGAGKSSVVEAIQWIRDAAFLGAASATPGHIDFTEVLNRRSRNIHFDLTYEHHSRPRPVHYTLDVVSSAQRPFRPIVAYESCIVGRTTGARRVLHSRKGKRGPTYRWVKSRGGSLAIRDSNELALRYTQTKGIAGAQDLVDFLARAVFLRLSPTAIAAPAPAESSLWRPLLSDDGHDLASLLLKLSAAARQRVTKRLSSIFPAVQTVDAEVVGHQHRFSVSERMRARGGTRVFDIPSSLLSEGMRRLVAIFALLESEPPPSLLVIEEVENGLDPWTLEHVLDAIRKVTDRVQVILTTHSPFLLDHVLPHEVIHVWRERGDTTYDRVSDLAQVARYDHVLAPGAMYLSNVFEEENNGHNGGKK